MTNPHILLASASPRRRELLAYLGIEYQLTSNDAEERDIPLPAALEPLLPPVPVERRFHPTILAWRKANTACSEVPQGVIIGADTIVVLDGLVLNKPSGPEEAQHMLRRLAGRTHTVYTGVAVIDQRGEEPYMQFAVEPSDVTIAELSDETIANYVATGEPLDKAGAYGIQGLGGKLVRAVNGSYTNVVGLPLAVVYRLLQTIGMTKLVEPSTAYQRWLVAQGKEPLPCPPTLP